MQNKKIKAGIYSCYAKATTTCSYLFNKIEQLLTDYNDKLINCTYCCLMLLFKCVAVIWYWEHHNTHSLLKNSPCLMCITMSLLRYLWSADVEAEASSSSKLCWNNSLFSLIKCLCISDIWAMIFSRRNLAISAFLFLSALSLSRTVCKTETPHTYTYTYT